MHTASWTVAPVPITIITYLAKNKKSRCVLRTLFVVKDIVSAFCYVYHVLANQDLA